MKVPCKECITLARCRIRAQDLLDTSVLSCPLVRKFIDPPERNMGVMYAEYRTRQVQRIRKVMGFRK